MPAPAFQAAGTMVSANAGNIAPAWPTHATDDIGILVVITNEEASSTPSGWTALSSSPIGSGSSTGGLAVRTHVYYKRAASSSESALSIAAAAKGSHAAILTFRGCVASGSPIDVNAAITDNGSPYAAAAVTTTVADTLVVVIVGHSIDANTTTEVSGWTNGALGSLTEIFDQGTDVGSGNGFAAAAGTKAAAGSTGTTAFTPAGGGRTANITFALKPVTDITGTLAGTDAVDTASFAGDVIVQGALAGTDAVDTASFAGDVIVQGALAGADTADTFAASGTVSTAAVTGTLAGTDAVDTASFTGAVVVQGALAGTDAIDTAALVGRVVVQGALAGTDAVDTAALVGRVIVQGALAGTDAVDTASFTGAATSGARNSFFAFF